MNKRGRKPKAKRADEFPPTYPGRPWLRPVQVAGPIDSPQPPTEAELYEARIRWALTLLTDELDAGRPIPAKIERELIALHNKHNKYRDELRLVNRIQELATNGVSVSRDGAFRIAGEEFRMSPEKAEAIYYCGPKFLEKRSKK